MLQTRSRYLLQISDCHLMPEPEQRFRGLNTDSTLQAVVADALAQGIEFDQLLLSGDLVHHGGADAYRRLLDMVAPLSGERHWIPGNHDEPAAMRAASDLPLGRECVVCGDWRLLLLDSTANPDGRGSGSLSEEQLGWLEQALETSAEHPVLILLHHNPLATGSLWQDQIMLGNAAEFARVVSAYSQVNAILCGHLHQHQALWLGDIPVWSAPASSIQFKPGQDDFLLEDDPLQSRPGYCIYRLDADGGISVQVRRVNV
ncbi:phosphodiesterase [Marinobacterium zhoushanense]|uniref:phosphodiesterase n=1 Tax=Marinobacterium zhoushanense TaxID=1679163 RepID=UPI0016699A2B|nr:phosphodiesterase [Marinobacterium zhoushanense]